MSPSDDRAADDPHAHLLDAFIAEPHDWHTLQQYCEATGRPAWEPGGEHPIAHPLDPLSEVLHGLTVAALLDEEADADAPPEQACDHTFVLTAASLREHGADEVSAFQQLVEQDVYCDHELVEQWLFVRGGSLTVLIEGWFLGPASDLADRLRAAGLAERVTQAPDADELHEGPLATTQTDDGLELWRQTVAGLHLLSFLNDVLEILGPDERLVFAVTFPSQRAEPPVLVLADSEDWWVADPEDRFDEPSLERADNQRLDRLLPTLVAHKPKPPRGGGKLPTRRQERWTFEQLTALIGAQGSEPVLYPPVLELPFRPGDLSDEAATVSVLRYLLNVAGFESMGLLLKVTPRTAERPTTEDRSGHRFSDLGGFEGFDGNRVVLSLDLSAHWDTEGLLATGSRLVAQAWRAHHGLTVDSTLEELQLVDLTSCYLGLGLFPTNASRRQRTWTDYSQYRGYFEAHSAHEQTGALSPVEMAFALALTHAARGGEKDERRQIARRLETDQKAYFKAACTYFDAADELVEELGLGPRSLRAPLRGRTVSTKGPFEPRDEVEVHEAEEALTEQLAYDEPAFGIQNRKPNSVTWALILGGIGGSVALGKLTPLGLGAALVALVWSFVMYFFGPGTRCHTCTLCDQRLEPDDEICPGCGRPLQGRVKDGYDWLEAKEKYEREADD